MTRYRYNQQVDPPAAFVHVTLLSPVGGKAMADLPAQVDTGADRTAIPLSLVEELALVPLDEMEVLGFGGMVATVRTFSVRLALRGGDILNLEVLGSSTEPHILLGRDVLNRYHLVLDGPGLVLEIR